MNLLLLAPLAALHLATSAATRVAVMPLVPGEGVSDKTAESLTTAVAAEVRKVQGLSVITQEEIASLISLDKQKAVLGCTDSNCLQEIGGALGVDRLVRGRIGKIGNTLQFELGLADVIRSKPLGQAQRLMKNGALDDALDALPSMVLELFGLSGALAASPSMSSSASSGSDKPSPNGADPAPAPWAEVPFPGKVDLAKYRVISDGKGHYVAFIPFGDMDDPLFAGDDRKLFQQRVFGGGSSGTESFSKNMWDPRAGWPSPSLNFVNGKYTVYCAKKELPYTALSEAESRKFLQGAKLFAPKWQRQAWAIAKDAEGNYYLLDKAREPDDSRDYRLYVGKKKALTFAAVKDVTDDGTGISFDTAAGTLSLAEEGEPPKRKATLTRSGGAPKPLTLMDLESSAKFIYTDLGVYKDALGTVCDGVL